MSVVKGQKVVKVKHAAAENVVETFWCWGKNQILGSKNTATEGACADAPPLVLLHW